MPAFIDLSFLNAIGFQFKCKRYLRNSFYRPIGFVFLICVIGMYAISMYETVRGVKTNGLEIDHYHV
jgi:SSS family solute:Na+ symporter